MAANQGRTQGSPLHCMFARKFHLLGMMKMEEGKILKLVHLEMRENVGTAGRPSAFIPVAPL